MGFNTVAFLLNDVMDSVSKCPHQAAYILTNPPMGMRDKQGEWERNNLRRTLMKIAQEHNEPMIHPQALEMMPTFHADDTTYFRAGGNTIDRLEFHKYGKLKDGRKTITLILPDYEQKIDNE